MKHLCAPRLFFKIITVLLLMQACNLSTPLRAEEFFFKESDSRIVLLGDSITEQRMYTTLIETYVLTRFPKWKTTFRNSGWGGDTAQLRTRGAPFDVSFQRDILDWQPKAITIDFGMNDARGGDGSYPKYVEFQTKLSEGLKKAGIRVALITPSPEEKYEAGAPAGSKYNVMLKKYSDGVREVAEKTGAVFVDQYTPFVALIEAGRKAEILGATGNPRLIPDGVHPNWAGHLIMASSILGQLHGPALVSSATLDAQAKNTTTQQCAIEWQTGAAEEVKFKRTDESLPWPVHPECALALKIPGFNPGEMLNQYLLQVNHLSADSYKLLIDDKEVGTYGKADLEKGVNLGFLLTGPIFDQQQKLLTAVVDKNNSFYKRWRAVQLFQFPDWVKNKDAVEGDRKNEIDRLDQEVAAKEKLIEELRVPQPHVFTLRPAK